MTNKVIKIVIDDNEILINRIDVKGLDLYAIRINSAGYAIIGTKGKLLHRIITKCPDDMEVDHINQNKLDCRRANLRICTRSQNLMNRPKSKLNKTGFRGVFFEKRKTKKYRARITVNKKTYNLGIFNTAEEASLAYKKAAKKYHGKFMYKENDHE